jgi:hypothetical protein
MKLVSYCAYCGGDRSDEIDLKNATSAMTLDDMLKPAKADGWIVEQNEPHLDLYCCKECSAGETNI